jgi:hypothetical protein
MKRITLLLLTALFFCSYIQAQKSKASKELSGYAITASEKGQSGWKEVRLVNIATGEELKSVYQSKQEVEILNARTGKAVVKKDGNISATAPLAKAVPVKKVVNLDNELNKANGVVTNVHVFYYAEGRNIPMQTDKPFATSSAAMAYDKKHERLYYTPMAINQLRYIDLKSNKIYYFEDEPFGVVTGMGDAPSQITRMVFASDGNGYALSNDGNHLIRFTAPKKVESTEITDLGALTDDAVNGRYSVHSGGGYGGDMIADAKGFLYLVTANHNVFRIDVNSKIATFLGTIAGLPQGFSTNGAMVEEGSKVIVASSQSTVGYYRFDLTSLQAERVSGGQQVFNASDLANGVLAFEKQKKQKKQPEIVEQKPAEQIDVAEEKQKPISAPDIANNNISVYPNPVTNGFFKVAFTDQPVGKYQLQLFDVSGKMISSKEVVINNKMQVEEYRLPSFITKGSYLLKVVGEKNNTPLVSQITVQ